MSYNWNIINLPNVPKFPTVTLNDNGKYGAIVGSTGLFTSSDFGITWNKTNANVRDNSNMYIDSSNNGQFIVYSVQLGDIGTPVSVFISNNFGQTFSKIWDTKEREIILGLSMDSTGQNINIITATGLVIEGSSYPYNIYTKNSGSNQFNNTVNIPNSNFSIGNVNNITFKQSGISSSKNNPYVNVLASPSILLISTNNGLNWVAVPYPNDALKTGGGLSISTNGQYIITGSTEKFSYLSQDYSKGFTEYQTSGLNSFSALTSITNSDVFLSSFNTDSSVSDIIYANYLDNPINQLSFFRTNSPIKNWVSIDTSLNSNYIISATNEEGIYIAKKQLR